MSPPLGTLSFWARQVEQGTIRQRPLHQLGVGHLDPQGLSLLGRAGVPQTWEPVKQPHLPPRPAPGGGRAEQHTGHAGRAGGGAPEAEAGRPGRAAGQERWRLQVGSTHTPGQWGDGEAERAAEEGEVSAARGQRPLSWLKQTAPRHTGPCGANSSGLTQAEHL